MVSIVLDQTLIFLAIFKEREAKKRQLHQRRRTSQCSASAYILYSLFLGRARRSFSEENAAFFYTMRHTCLTRSSRSTVQPSRDQSSTRGLKTCIPHGNYPWIDFPNYLYCTEREKFKKTWVVSIQIKIMRSKKGPKWKQNGIVGRTRIGRR